MTAGIKANNDGSAAIQVGGTDYIQIASTGPVTIPGNLAVTGTITTGGFPAGGNYILNQYVAPATWTKPGGLKAIKVTVVGAGGNGGSSFTSTPTAVGAAGGGGGGGGAAIYYVPAPSIPGPISVTAGPGTNSFGALASATAGSNGSAGTSSTANGAGGSGGTGTVPSPGTSGQIAFIGTPGYAGAFLAPGYGGGVGSSVIFMGQVAVGGASGSSPASASVIIGSGGGGGGARPSPSPGTNTGGAGAPGIVIVEEFY